MTNFFLMLVLGNLGGAGQGDTTAASDQTAKNVPEAKPDFVSVQEEMWLRLADEPSRLMKQADESFLRKDDDMASRELLRVTAYLHGSASHADQDAKLALESSAAEMDRLAMRLKAGAVKSGSELEEAFARAEHALATHKWEKARAALDQKQYKFTGSYLDTAVSHLESAAAWTGYNLESGSSKVFALAYETSGKLVTETGFAVRDVGAVLDDIGKEIHKLATSIKPQSAEAK
jgi:hypothetical protein